MKDMQRKYWLFMTQKRYEILYAERFFRKSIKIQRIMDIVIALASLSSVGGWLAYAPLAFLWGGIIALSHIIVLIRPHLPYDKRADNIQNLFSLWRGVYLEIERDWYPISTGQVSEKSINNKIFDYNKRWIELETEYMKNDSFALAKKEGIAIAEENKTYFDRLTGVGVV